VEDEAATHARLIADAQQALAAAQLTAPMATFILDVDRETTDLSPALRELWGISGEAEHARLSDFLKRIHPDDRQRVAEIRSEALRTRRPYVIEYRMIRENGEVRHIRTEGQFFYDERAHALRNVGVVVDVTEHMRAVTAAKNLFGRDRLTGLLDRSAFTDLVLEAAGQSHPPFAVVVFDLVDFRRINEAHGTAAGDEVLRAFARRLLSVAREGESFARLGGDEFAAFFLVGDGGIAEALARMEFALSEPVSIGKEQVVCNATFGVSVFPTDARDESLIVKASLAMTQARREGAAGAERYRPEMERLFAERRLMQLSLRGALERDEFEMYFQPVVNARSMRVEGAEALIRWNHPELGVVPPNVFLSAAEDAGLMKDVDAWAFRNAAVTAAPLFARNLFVAVNLTAHFLLAPELEATLAEILQIDGVREHLCIEITEQSLLADRAQAQSAITSIRRAGIRIALDDFGTGYNTLSYLKIYPIDTVKIDRSFVSDLEEYPYSRSVCSAILALASELGLEVIAEGVESKAQEEFLRTHGCGALQGYLYGRPMPIGELLRALDATQERAS
jgi:diguanylate cyclase (GGDEF)-like protein/PAS domain S-box-containing protein